MGRKKIVAGNWKMHTTPSEGLELSLQIAKVEKQKNTLVIIAAPFTHLWLLRKKIPSRSGLKLAAQNVHHLDSGAYTGEVSASMLKSMDIPYVLIGHSERRMYYHEDNQLLLEKIKTALRHGLKVIFCCGEPLDVRKSGTHELYVKKQLEDSLFPLDPKDLKNIIIAYEPIWAIGTGETATPEQAQDMHAAIRKMINKKFGKRISENMQILYGGSVKSSNASEIFSKSDVDGGLVGGASLQAEEFAKIILSA